MEGRVKGGDRADVIRARRCWMREQGMFGPARRVFIDETSINTLIRHADHFDFMATLASTRKSSMRDQNRLIKFLEEEVGGIQSNRQVDI